ncbi:MAG: 1-deoxy-D-xylulose-5-phosphate reductoisomerase [Gammaproteobacteria bacterium]
MKSLVVLGATGSIGKSTLDVVRRHRDRYSLFALTANTAWELLAELCLAHHPEYAVIVDESCGEPLRSRLRQGGCKTEVLTGGKALEEVAGASEVDYVMAAIVGAAGLPATLKAATAGKRVLLANKESLVMAGRLFMEAVKRSGAELLPIDSEHNAVFQCMPQDRLGTINDLGISKILLTASGGPFRETPLKELAEVTPERAVAHPNWEMGKKISVDSATMMNKGLEVIEAKWLFDADPDRIEVFIHPQSIVHSLVQYSDGSVLAQLGNPDMRTPIAHALGWPERIASGVEPLDLLAVEKLTFSAPDDSRFPCLRLAYQALALSDASSIVLNAANEVAVDAFLKRRIRFTQIAETVERVLNEAAVGSVRELGEILEIDHHARVLAESVLNRVSTP